MTAEMTPPLFGVIEGVATFFKDVAYATGYIEVPEVEAGEWRLFDSVGREFKLGVRGFDVVASEEAAGADPFYLRAVLRESLANVPKKRRCIALPDIGVASLPELVAEFSRLHGRR